MTLYDLKPRFQALLRPLVAWLADIGVTANQVTVAAMVGSMIVAGLVIAFAAEPIVFLALPAWLFVRMGLNAVDGMLAREFGQKSVLGAYLNEITDVISDAALYLPFAFVAPFDAFWVALVIFLSAMSEFSGVLGPAVGASRRYDGPLGKSDRALFFGTLGTAVALIGSLPGWVGWSMPVVALLLILTTVNRVRAGLVEAGNDPA